MSEDADPTKHDIDESIRAHLAPFLDQEVSEMVSTWVVVAVTSCIDDSAATHVLLERNMPTWQVKGLLTHALDVVKETIERE